MCVAWLIYICDTTYACMWHDVCCMTHSYMWHDSCLYVTYFNQTCVWHVSSIRLASIIQICDMMHALRSKEPPPPRGGFLFTMFPHQEPWGARSKWRGFSPAATARHSQQARVHTDSRQKKNRKNFRLRPLTGVRLNLKFQWKTEYIATNDMRKGMGSENENKFSKNCNKFFKNFWFPKINK
jgi:hypothetical protein